jgi:hypothetical protein
LPLTVSTLPGVPAALRRSMRPALCTSPVMAKAGWPMNTLLVG